MMNLPDKEELLNIFQGISQDVHTLVRQEGMLLRAELQRDAGQAAKIAGEMAVAGVIAGMGSLLLTLAVVFGLTRVFPELPLWGSFASVGLILALVSGALVTRALGRAKQLELTPTQSLRSLKKDLNLLAPGA